MSPGLLGKGGHTIAGGLGRGRGGGGQRLGGLYVFGTLLELTICLSQGHDDLIALVLQ